MLYREDKFRGRVLAEVLCLGKRQIERTFRIRGGVVGVAVDGWRSREMCFVFVVEKKVGVDTWS